MKKIIFLIVMLSISFSVMGETLIDKYNKAEKAEIGNIKYEISVLQNLDIIVPNFAKGEFEKNADFEKRKARKETEDREDEEIYSSSQKEYEEKLIKILKKTYKSEIKSWQDYYEKDGLKQLSFHIDFKKYELNFKSDAKKIKTEIVYKINKEGELNILGVIIKNKDSDKIIVKKEIKEVKVSDYKYSFVQGNESISDFYIGRFEVTQVEYDNYMNPENSYMDRNIAAIKVSWFGAIVFCNKLSEKEGKIPYYKIKEIEKDDDGTIRYVDFEINGGNGYRLLTKKEWEYAARGGKLSKSYKFSGSNDIDEVAWYEPSEGNCIDVFEVGLKKPNELGIYDMLGNMSEWCWDRDTNRNCNRIIKGGSLYTGKERCIIENTNSSEVDSAGMDTGLRIGYSK